MATQIIINARSMQVSASVDASGSETTIFAVDLAGDTWHDFTYFTEKAKEYEARGELNLRNRYVRSAISNLFSHFDAVVSDIYDAILQNPQISTMSGPKSLMGKMLFINDHAKKKFTKLPYVDLSLKLLRDIVNHPSITKSRFEKRTQETLLYNGSDVYGISTDELHSAGLSIDRWLNRACTIYNYVRFCDTAKLCLDFAQQLGDNNPEVNLF